MRVMRIEAPGLIDVRSGRLVERQAILVKDGRVVEVGPASAVATPDGALASEFPHGVLIPGLIDTHTHLCFSGDGRTIEEVGTESRAHLLLRAANNSEVSLRSGVTSLCDNGSYDGLAIDLRDAIATNLLRGPDIFPCRTPLTITGGHCWPMGGEADGVEGIRRAVRAQVKRGASWIKVIASGGGTRGANPNLPAFTLEELRAAAHEAHSLGMRCAGHALCTSAVRSVLAAGFDMIIHGDFYRPDGTYEFDETLADEIAATGTWVNPTLHVARATVWRLEALKAERELTDQEAAELKRRSAYVAEGADELQRLVARGVRVVAGSDAGWRWYRFGRFCDEVEALSAAGMGPGRALKSATLDAADALGMREEAGSLEVGRRADILVLRGNPLEDIHALADVEAVFLAGERVL